MVGAHPFNTSAWKQRKGDRCEFEASLVYRVSSSKNNERKKERKRERKEGRKKMIPCSYDVEVETRVSHSVSFAIRSRMGLSLLLEGV